MGYRTRMWAVIRNLAIVGLAVAMFTSWPDRFHGWWWFWAVVGVLWFVGGIWLDITGGWWFSDSDHRRRQSGRL